MSRFRISLVAAVACLISTCAQQCRAEVILGPSQLGADATPYFRFTGGFQVPPSSTINNSSFYLPSLDLSGVGWKLPGVAGSLAWNVAMIDNVHFVGAWHVAVTGNMSVGDTINFRPAGTSSIVTATVANLQNVPNPDSSTSDVLLGTLARCSRPGAASPPIRSRLRCYHNKGCTFTVGNPKWAKITSAVRRRASRFPLIAIPPTMRS